MPKCPYCKEELEIKVEINSAPINDKFRDDILKVYEAFIEIQAEIIPFGGKMLKSMAKYGLKFVDKYLDRIGAMPLIWHSCTKCDSVITSDSLVDLMSSKTSGSS